MKVQLYSLNSFLHVIFCKPHECVIGTKNVNLKFILKMIERSKIDPKSGIILILCEVPSDKYQALDGNEIGRRNAVQKVLARLGEKAYSIIFNNCEYFKNSFSYEESKSH